MNRNLKINFLITLFILALIYPTYKLTQQSQENRNLAKEKNVGSIEVIKPIEEKTVKITANKVAETKILAKNEKLQIKFEKGVFGQQAILDREIKLTLHSSQKEDKLLYFSLELKSGNKTELANNIPYEISYDYSDLNAIYAPSTLSFVYRNPKNGIWEKIPTTLDLKNNKISAKLNHFSDFGVTGDKAQVFSPTLKNWETSLYTGSATYSYPISLLPGKGGFAPSFAADYSSHRANGTFDDQKGSWLGVGWDMTVPEIRFEKFGGGIPVRGYSCSSHLGTTLGGNQYVLVLSGVEEPMMWIGDGNDATGSFGKFISKTTNMEIRGYYGIYKGSTLMADENWCPYQMIIRWVVKDTSGTEYTFAVNEANTPNRKVDYRMIPTRYLITKMVDAYGNIVEFENQAPSWEKDAATGHIFGAYPYRVKYNNGRTIVQFTVVQKSVFPTNGADDKNFEKSRLARIEIFPDFTSNPSYINKTYRFIYYPKETYGFDTLKKIVEYASGTAPSDTDDPNGDAAAANKFVTGEFTYENKPVGIQYAYTEGNGGCRAGTSVNSWDKLASFARAEGEFGEECWIDITKKLRDAGFGNCGGDRIIYNPFPDPSRSNKLPGIPLCPITAEGESIAGESAIGVWWEKNKAPFLTKVTNGYGGEIYFTYTNIHKGSWWMDRNVVSSKRTSDANFKDKGTPDITVNYEYHPIVGSGQKINKGGGFGRVSQTDPVTGISTTTTFYPLAPEGGEGGTIDPNIDPYFGSPLRTVVHKIEGTNDKIYSDTFYTYSFIPPYAPDFGLTDNLLNTERARVDTWKNYKIIDNILNEGFGKKVTTTVDSFSPVKTNFITVPVDSVKPQFIPNATRLDKNQLLHTQQRSYYDRYGYQIKSASLGDVNDTVNGFSITDANANLSTGRTAGKGGTGLSYINPWWMDSVKFTYGLPFVPVLFTSTINGVASNGWEDDRGDPDFVNGVCYYSPVCCHGERDPGGSYFGCDVCTSFGSGDHINPNLVDRCRDFKVRTNEIYKPLFSGTPGSLTKYSYTKYVRTADYLSKNMTGLVSESFISDQDMNTELDYINNVYISDLKVFDTTNASDWLNKTNLQVGNSQYGDRSYAFTSVPASVAGANWISTANDSKTSTQNPVVTFKLNNNSTVYVAQDDRVTSTPSWLVGWINTGADLINNESSPKTFSLYSKYFTLGSTVSLGSYGNGNFSMYTIIIKAEPAAVPTVTPVLTSTWKLSQNTYNDKGRMTTTKLIDTSENREAATPSEITTSVTYDEVGNVISQTDARGNTSFTDYYTSTDKPYYKVLPVAQRQSFTNSEGALINLTTTTSYNDNWQPVKNTDPNGMESVVSYDCLGRLKNVYKGDPITGIVPSLYAPPEDNPIPVPVITYFYFDYQGDNCGLGAKGNLPHLRTKTRISSSDSNNEYVYTDQISDGLGNAKQNIVLKTKINGVDKSLITESWYNERGLIDWSSQPVEIDPILNCTGPLCPDPSTDPVPAYRFLTLTDSDKTRYTYDELGRTTLVTDPLGQQTTTAFNGMQTTVTDANNVGKTNAVSSSTLVDGWGRKVKSWTVNLSGYIPGCTGSLCNDPANPTHGLVSYPTYDLLDNVTLSISKICNNPTCTSTETELQRSESVFDHLGRKWQVTDPDLGTWKFAYDANGNIVKQKDAKNQVLTFEYDPLNRLTKKVYPDGKFIQNIYDKDGTNVMIGKKLRMVDLAGESTSEYDKRGRLKNQHQVLNKSIAGGTGQETADTAFTYFESDALKSTTLPTGEIVEQKINEIGQLTGTTLSNSTPGCTGPLCSEESINLLSNQTYSKWGTPNIGTLGNGLQTLNEYDSIGRLKRICTGTNCETGINKLMDYKYPSRDKVGNILAINNEVTDTSAFKLNFSYDNQYQLTKATATKSCEAIGGMCGLNNTTCIAEGGQSYGTMNCSNSICCIVGPTPTINYTATPWSSSYIYDSMGNMTAKTEGADTVNMEYTDTGHKHAPKVVNGFTYIYDANGNLTEDEARCLIWDYDNKPTKIIMKQTKGEVGCVDYISGTKTGVITEFMYDGDGNRVMKKVIEPCTVSSPNNLKTTISDGNKVNFSWDPVMGANRYILEVRKKDDSRFASCHLENGASYCCETQPASGSTCSTSDSASPDLLVSYDEHTIIDTSKSLTFSPGIYQWELRAGKDVSSKTKCFSPITSPLKEFSAKVAPTANPTFGPVSGDFNHDGKINYLDTIMLITNWFTGNFDLNMDNKINAVDFTMHHLLVNPVVPTPTPTLTPVVGCTPGICYCDLGSPVANYCSFGYRPICNNNDCMCEPLKYPAPTCIPTGTAASSVSPACTGLACDPKNPCCAGTVCVGVGFDRYQCLAP